MSTIIYIGNFSIGKMDAQSQLVLGNCKIFRELGYNVVLIGNDNALAGSGDIFGSKRIIEGFECYNINFNKNLKGFLQNIKTHKQIEKVLELYHNVKFLISYGSPAFAIELFFLSKWCQKKAVQFIANRVDISNQSHGNPIERIVKKTDRYYLEKIVRNKSDGIIAVSTYIANHYKQYNKKVIIVPPLKDCKQIESPLYSSSNKHVNLLYAGMPFPTDGRKVDVEGYKDRLDLLIDALCYIRGKTKPFCLNIYGLTKEQYTNVVSRHKGILMEFDDVIKFHGLVSHEEVLKAERIADFTTIIRVRNVMTMAGFSTKIVESISYGVPVLTTDTSDYSRYIKQGENGFILPIDDEMALRCQLVKIFEMDRSEINRLKKMCYSCQIFDFRNYISVVNDFLKEVGSKGDLHGKTV